MFRTFWIIPIELAGIRGGFQIVSLLMTVTALSQYSHLGNQFDANGKLVLLGLATPGVLVVLYQGSRAIRWTLRVYHARFDRPAR